MIFKYRKTNLILWDYIYLLSVFTVFAVLLLLFNYHNTILLPITFLFSSILIFLILEYRVILLFIIYFTIATYFRTPRSLFPITFTICEIFIVFLFILSLRDISIKKLINYIKNSPVKYYILYVLIMLISIIINFFIDIEHSFSTIRDLIIPLILFIGLVSNVDNKNIKSNYLMLAVVVIIMGLIGIIQSVFGKLNFITYELERNYLSMIIGRGVGMAKPATGLFSKWNTFALYLQIYLTILFSFSISAKKSKIKIISIMLFVFILIVEFLTFSRGGYISILISMITVMFIYSKRTRFVSIVLFSSIILFIIIIIIPKMYYYFDQFQTIFYRFALWNKGIEYLIKHPNKILFGTGLGTYENLLKVKYTAHNIYILHLVESGIFSLITFILFIYKFLRYILLSYTHEKNDFNKSLLLGLFAGYVGYYFHEFIEHSFISIVFKNQIIVWLVILVIINSHKSITNNKNIVNEKTI